MGAVSVLAIIIFGTIGLGVVVVIVLLLASALQSDSDRRRLERYRRLEKAGRSHDRHDSG